jgi:hypothetical protein
VGEPLPSIPPTRRDGFPRKNAPGKVYARRPLPDARYRVPPPKPASPIAPKPVWATRALLGVGTFVAAMVYTDQPWRPEDDFFPTDDFEKKILSDSQDAISKGADSWDVRKWALSERAEHQKELLRAKEEEQKENPTPEPGSEPDHNVRVRKKDPCDIKRYGSQDCPPGSEKHHIVPDRVLRYGARGDTASRIPDMPSLRDGPTICLEGAAGTPGTEHNQIHQMVDPKIAALGDANGMAPLRKVMNVAVEETSKLKKDCAEKIKKAVEDAFGPKADQMVRTANDPITPPAAPAPPPEPTPPDPGTQSIPF